MLQCGQCEFFLQDQMGRIHLHCNPFTNVKEPECLKKWELVKLDILVRSYQATVNFYQKLAPLQEKMIKHIEREIEEIEEGDKWKHDEKDQEDDQDDLDQDQRLP